MQLTLPTPPTYPSSTSKTYAILGNPNAGKTTLFNQLTGLNQKTANYPGVTVNPSIGSSFSLHGEKITLIDLPGLYSLGYSSSDEETLASHVLSTHSSSFSPKPNRLICVAEASNLQRHLYLVTQALELGYPTILVITMPDDLQKTGSSINYSKLQSLLHIPVLPFSLNSQKDLINLKLTLGKPLPTPPPLNLPSTILTSDNTAIQQRFSFIQNIITQSLYSNTPTPPSNLTQSLDKILLHPIASWPILLLIVLFVFYSLFSLAPYPINFIDSLFSNLKSLSLTYLPPGPLNNLFSNGILSGISAITIFLPQIFLLFFFLNLLESSGYLPRASFILDKPLSKFGLQGKALLPLLSAFACAVPAIAASKIIPSFKERLAIIFITPLMSCSARLPIYLLIISTLVPDSHPHATLLKSIILLSAYLLGPLTALLISLLLRTSFLKEPSLCSLSEMPKFRLPSLKSNLLSAYQYTALFIQKSSLLILSFSIILSFLSSYPNPNSPSPLQSSFIAQFSNFIQPLFAPLGFDWKITIATLISFAARELFPSTLAILYSQDLPSLSYSTPTSLSIITFFIFALQCFSTLAAVYKETNSLKWPLIQFLSLSSLAYLAALLTHSLSSFLLS